MADAIRAALELGPKGKRVVAIAQDWPGLARGAKSEPAAIERLTAYLPRYAPVARLAGMEDDFPIDGSIDVIEHYPGVGSTDFWGISFAFSTFDQQAISEESLDRDLRLLQGCWAFFDQVRTRVSAELERGPRGGGRNRDQIVGHTIVSEQDMVKKLGIHTPEELLRSLDGLDDRRITYCETIRAFHAEGKSARRWPLRYLIRHMAFHTLDHAWEMEDKDLTSKSS